MESLGWKGLHSTPNVDVFGTGKTLPGRDGLNQPQHEPCRLQLCAVLRAQLSST
jgi:hypothetical protein